MKEAERLKDLEGLYRLYRCRGIMNCASVCPKGLNPSAAIASVRERMVKRELVGQNGQEVEK